MHVIILRTIGLLLLGSIIGFVVGDYMGDAQVTELKLAYQQEQTRLENVRAEQATTAEKRLREAQEKIANADKENTAALSAQRAELARLNDCLRTGACGLRIQATCPATVSATPGGPARAGMDDGTYAALTPVAESAYFALREGITQKEQQLTMCQDYVATLRDGVDSKK